jgi:hypothetical protein
MVVWLETEPQRAAKELLHRLRSEGEPFTDGQPRTLQRRIKAWRLQAARRLIFSSQLLSHDAATAVRTS